MRNDPDQTRRIYQQLATTNKALESTSDAIIVADNDGVAIYVNPAFVGLFDYSVTELNVGGIPNVLFEKPAVGEQVFKLVRQGGAWSGEVDLQTKSGRTIPFLLNVDQISSDQDEPIGFISVCTDITQQKLLRAIQREQRILAEAQLDTLRTLTSTLDLDEVLARILDNIGEVVPNDAANIILIEEGYVRLVDRDDYSGRAEIERLKSGEVPVTYYDDLKEIAQTGMPLVISNTKQQLTVHDDMQVHTPWLNSHIGIPIRLHSEVIGFLNVDSIQPGIFGHEHASRLQLFSEQAAIAIHNARLHEQEQMLAKIEERRRLARNLHDSVSQTLFSANLIAEALPQLWEKRPDEVFSQLERIQKLNQSALVEMRMLLLELHPERLVETEIGELLQQFVVGLLGQGNLNVTLEVAENIELPPKIHEAIYYITQEALNNVVKHAEATKVAIELEQSGQQIYLRIADNGRGFDPEQIAPNSLGLSIIQERAQETAANLNITSEIGEGTEISVYWTI